MNDIVKVSDIRWDIGEERSKIIKVLAEQRRCSRSCMLDAVNMLNMSECQIYRLIKKYRQSHGLLTSLIPQKPNGGKGKPRLNKVQEKVIEEVIEDHYLTSQKRIPARIVEEVRNRCLQRHIKSPSNMTIRRRLDHIKSIRLKVRGENNISEPIFGSFPHVQYPLSVVQIDHTLVDIILVDPIDRLPIGRPYLTLAIDVYSRCIAGFVLSLEAPSSVSVGLSLTHIAQDKTALLVGYGIDALWPIHGKPEKIYVDLIFTVPLLNVAVSSMAFKLSIVHLGNLIMEGL